MQGSGGLPSRLATPVEPADEVQYTTAGRDASGNNLIKGKGGGVMGGEGPSVRFRISRVSEGANT